jgi:hypothetical protein
MKKEQVNPVFIMGAPRSGTTMLAAMLANRSDSVALPEMHFIHEPLVDEMVFGVAEKSETASILAGHYMFRDLAICSGLESVKNILCDSFADTALNIVDIYNRRYLGKEYRMWVEHSPRNHIYFEALQYHYPNAKFIHIVRDGRAVYASGLNRDWAPKDVLAGASDWKDKVMNCAKLAAAYPDKVLTVKYEKLVAAPEDTMRTIATFLSVTFTEQMLRAEGIIPPKFALRTLENNKTPHARSVGKWKSSLSSHEKALFSQRNKKLLEHFGYEVKEEYLALKCGHLWKVSEKIKGLVKSFLGAQKAHRRYNKNN